MAEKKQLGIYWGENSFCFAETEKGKLLKSSSVPFTTQINTYQTQDIPESLRFTTLIQKALQDLNITNKKVNLSLPAKDIIFRSFVIPWMEPEEIRNVVDFEAIKYIPIKLEDLAYTYHPITINENNQKNVRIIFVAARKDVLAKYISILEHTGLTVDWAEPSPMSLVRVLEQKGHLPHNTGTAIIQIESQGGKIIFVDQDVVQFVREFQLPIWDASNQGDVENFTSRLFNEIRVSLNFYSRQNPHGKIIKIIALSLHDLPNLGKNLSENMNIPSSVLTVSTVLKTTSANEVGLLNAFGIGLRNKKSVFNNFNLFNKTVQPVSSGLKMDEPGYKIAAFAVVFAVVIVGLAFSLTKNMSAAYKEKLNTLQSGQTGFGSSTADDLTKLEKDANSKLTAYKDVRTKSKMSYFLARLPELLPPGAWIKTWDINYQEKTINETNQENARTISRLTMDIEGYVYLENTNEQFRLVNNLIGKLKETKDFKETFGSIDLVAVRQETVNTYPVTYFKIGFK